MGSPFRNAHLYVLLIASLSSLFSCASKMVSEKEGPSGRAESETTTPKVASWTAKMQVEDLETNKKDRMDLEILAEKPRFLRMDVKGTFGIVGASGALLDDQMTLLLPRQKKAYVGKASANSLLPFLKIQMDPKLMISVFFDEQIPSWNCKPSLALERCESEDGITIQTLERSSDRRKVEIKGLGFLALMVIRPDGTKVSLGKEQFQLQIPDGYRTYKLP